ncbi:hypothetical protein LINGRAHAP2_LOCUS8560, partial [Linum grandiflorum]
EKQRYRSKCTCHPRQLQSHLPTLISSCTSIVIMLRRNEGDLAESRSDLIKLAAA